MSKEAESFAARLDGIFRRIGELQQQWRHYRAFLKAKYPPGEGEEWEFTCPDHRVIDFLLSDLAELMEEPE